MLRSWAQVLEAFISGQVNVVHLLSPMTVWAALRQQGARESCRLESYRRLRPQRRSAGQQRQGTGRQDCRNSILVFDP